MIKREETMSRAVAAIATIAVTGVGVVVYAAIDASKEDGSSLNEIRNTVVGKLKVVASDALDVPLDFIEGAADTIQRVSKGLFHAVTTVRGWQEKLDNFAA